MITKAQLVKMITTTVWGNPVWVWPIAFIGALFAIWVFSVIQNYLSRKLIGAGESRKSAILVFFGKIILQTKPVFAFLLALYVGSILLKLPKKLDRLLFEAAVASVFLQLTFWTDSLISYWISRRAESLKEQDASRTSGFGALSFVLKAVLWTIVCLLLLENLGIDVTALLAGLGIGGVAVALALQNILGDLLCSISILLDKPFEVGDSIVIDDKAGTVEKIGIKSTRLRSVQGEQIVVSNSDLIKSRIQNFKRMTERRVSFTISVIYDTALEKLEKLPKLIQQVVESVPSARFDRAHLKELGGSSLNFEVVYYCPSNDYKRYMDMQQEMNLKILRAFESEDIRFAALPVALAQALPPRG